MDNWTINDVDGGSELVARMAKAGSDIQEWSKILNDHIKAGNLKISSRTAVFNMGSATDCPNLMTKYCQVGESCYALRAEKVYKTPLDYRRRQEYIWNSLDADTFVEAFRAINSRKRKPFDTIRFNESGEFGTNGDIVRLNEIARQLKDDGITVYTYSASAFLDWPEKSDRHFTLNASNDMMTEYADRRYMAIDKDAELPEGSVWCPYDKFDGGIKCGDCRLCVDKAAGDVAIPIH